MTNNLFYCYNFNLHSFLKQNGLKYITTARNINSYDQFWLYERNGKLDDLINTYKTI